MCGVAAIFSYHYAAPDVNKAELLAIRDRMASRGPDGDGVWLSDNGRVGLGHRRLAVIDLSDRASQPMVSADGGLVISYNGEIYNYKALRLGLEKDGVVFRTESDTEVLLHLYQRMGTAMLHELRGMFALALWDTRSGRLWLARDPYGIKPLYYADDGWTVRVASQVKALLVSDKVSKQPEPAGVVGFYLFGSVPEPFTTYQEVRAVPAGSWISVGAMGPEAPVRYQPISALWQNHTTPAVECAKSDDLELRSTLLDCVKHHMVSDVPVGAFLSAGIDSGALVGLMRDAGQVEIQTVTIAFKEFEGSTEDEAPLAEKLSEYYGTRHTTRVVTEAEFNTDLPVILEEMDQPSIDGINTWFVSKAARELGLKVVVSGLGGDELFGGYPSFADLPRWTRWFGLVSRIPVVGDGVRMLTSPLANAMTVSPKVAGMVKYGGTIAGAYLLRRGLFMPWELPRLVGREISAEGLRRLGLLEHIEAAIDPDPGSVYARVACLESSLYMRNQLLRDTDWASMAHSLEVRVPLVDLPTTRQVATVSETMNRLVAKACLVKAPRNPLPSYIARRSKTGFLTPVKDWLNRNELVRDRRYFHLPGAHWSRNWGYSIANLQLR